MLKLVVGAPIRRREFCAEQWVDHVAQATVHAGIHDKDLTFVFVSHPDDPTNEILDKSAAIYDIRTIFVPDEEEPTTIKRDWTSDRIQTMVRVRNLLLAAVREEKPDLFLSLDSDILLNRGALLQMAKMFDHIDKYGKHPQATSHCVHLHPTSRRIPNFANLSRTNHLVRNEHKGELIGVDVIMAAKLMLPVAYNIDYAYHQHGEDIGWSIAARSQSLVLAWTGTITSKHIMHPDDLLRMDPRCGY